MKAMLKKFIPSSLLKAIRPLYHGLMAWGAGVYFGNPSLKVVVIGVTGTAGKSSTVNVLGHILNSSGKKTGFITTTNYSYGGESFLNKHGLSMPNEWLLQTQLAEMVKSGCEFAIVECTSEGLAQNRHSGITFDLAVFTNLSAAHLDSHGSMENYRAAKGKLFASLNQSKKKSFFPKKIIGVNLDDRNAEYFLKFPADNYFGISMGEAKEFLGRVNIFTIGEVTTEITSKFKVQDTHFSVSTPGEFSIYNAMMAIATANTLGVSLGEAASAMETFTGVPGRMENIENSRGLQIIVDYACEPRHFEQVLPAVRSLTRGKLIHVFGSTGGHRDVSKRFVFGKLAAQSADEIIVTNDDVYDSDPVEIAQNIEHGIQQVQGEARKVSHYEIILDRKTAIKKALEIARMGDTILFTGKGSEQFLVLPENKRIPWDERVIIKQELSVTSNQ